MKEIILPLASYNVWANQLMAQALVSLPEETTTRELPSSFNSLLKTVLHMLDAESIWWQRVKLSERIVIPSENFNGNMHEAVNQLLQVSRQWQEWVQNAQEHMLQHEFIYHNSKKEQFKQPVWQMLIHLFNHGTYHRGQLITMLRQAGVEKIPQTDFIVFARKK
jgi:uncharacterized damage-inducible protein DinB